MDDDFKNVYRIGMVGAAILISTIGGCMYGMPKYNVYHQQMEGEAELAKANFSKQTAIQEAHAKMESAKLLADAEVIRAEGVAKANKIIGDSLNNNEAYLRYLYINNLEHSQNQIIYVPTEANLPILERRK
jgi:regulator of protease activity HflC (stomatin/prohibitin superfamily)